MKGLDAVLPGARLRRRAGIVQGIVQCVVQGTAWGT